MNPIKIAAVLMGSLMLVLMLFTIICLDKEGRNACGSTPAEGATQDFYHITE